MKVPGVMEGWHTFSLLWLPDEYVFYVDGKETWRTKAGGVCQVPFTSSSATRSAIGAATSPRPNCPTSSWSITCACTTWWRKSKQSQYLLND